MPAGSTIGLLFNPKNPASGPEKDDVLAAARQLHLEIHAESAGSESEIDAAFARFVEKRISAVTFAADAVYNSRRAQLIALAERHKLPTMYFYRAFAEAGGLISYGVDLRWCYRRGAYFVDKILHGTPPGELPVEFPTKMMLSINLKTAKALGLTVPPALLSLVDEVIE